MGIKEQTVSVHIRRSYRYRRAPYNRNRRSKRAPVSFPRRFLRLRSFCRLALPPRVLAYSLARSHYRYVFANYAVLRINHATSCGRRKSEKRPARRVRSPASSLSPHEESESPVLSVLLRRNRRCNYRKNNGPGWEVTGRKLMRGKVCLAASAISQSSSRTTF